MDPRSIVFAAAALAAGAALPPTAPARAETGSGDAVAAALLTRYVEMKNAHDATRMSEIFPENYVEHSGRNPSGLAALTKNWENQLAGIPDVKLTLEDRIISGDKVVARITYAGTYTRPFLPNIPPNGKPFTFGTIDIWRVVDGKLAEHWDQVDFAGLDRQLQAPPAPAKP